MILIGSQAIKAHFPEFREPQDWDLWATWDEIGSLLQLDWVKFHRLDKSGRKLQLRSPFGRIEVVGYRSHPADPRFELASYMNGFGRMATELGDELAKSHLCLLPLHAGLSLSLKKSHLHVPLKSWRKHMEDYHWLKSRFLEEGMSLETPETWKSTFKLLRKEAEGRIKGKGSPSLNMPKEEFFGRSVGVDYKFDHDEVHAATAFNKGRPHYTRMQHDPSLAKCDKDLWEEFTHQEKVETVQEEAAVISIERKVLPGLMSFEEGFEWAIMRICTTLTSGWFRRFAIENWPECRIPRKNFMKDFKGEFDV